MTRRICKKNYYLFLFLCYIKSLGYSNHVDEKTIVKYKGVNWMNDPAAMLKVLFDLSCQMLNK